MRPLLVAGAFALFATVAGAQTEPAPAPTAPLTVSPDQLAAARKVAEAQGGIETIQASVSAMRNYLVATIADLSKKPPAEVAPLVDKIILPELNAHAAELMEIDVGVYAAHFTPAELQGIVTFYESPVGRKLSHLQPVIVRETVGAAREWARRVLPDALRKHADELKQHGLNL